MPAASLSTRKGQSANNAMWLVLMIGLFLVVYIILLPVGEKEKLVGEKPIYGTPPGPGGYPGGQITSGLLLSENPGLVNPLIRQVIGKPLASVNLYSYTQSGGEGLANSITIKNDFFGEDDKKLTFYVKDLEHVQDAQLLFMAKEGKGDLIIILNDEEIFRGEITSADLPLTLPRQLLKQVNKLEFQVSGPGINIFKTNTYTLKDVQIFYKSLIENRQEARTFVLSKNDLSGLKHMTLFFVVNCFTVNEQGRLIVALNGKIISDGLVVCDAGPVSVDIDPQDLAAGTNVLQFGIDKGKYELEQIVLEKDVGEHEPVRYVFTMQVADFQVIGAGRHVLLDMLFNDDGLRKIGAVYVNGYPVYIDTLDYRFGYDITGLVGPGSNTIRIVPEVPMDIVSMNIGFA